MLGLKVALTDLDATASKSVGDLLGATGLVVTTGVCGAWLIAVVTVRELICTLLKLKLSVLV